MKFQLLSTSLALLGASAVSGQKQLRGIQHQPLSVLLAEDYDYDYDGPSASTTNSGSVDLFDGNSEDTPTSPDSNYLDSSSEDDTGSEPSSDELYSDMFIAVSNNDKGYCDGRGWNTCDNRRQACEWVGQPRSSNGYCRDRNGGGGNNKSCQNRGFNGCRNNSYYCHWVGSERSGYCTNKNSGGGSFDDGLRDGRQTGEKLWRDMGGDCANAWRNFKTSINREIKNRGWNTSNGNWKTNSYNDGARKGMQEALDKYEKKCFHDSSDECIDLGNEAARMIAYNFCGGYSSSRYQSYRATCRQVAINQCKGQVYGNVRSQCGSQKSNDINRLQNQCSNQVKSMIGDKTEELFFMED